MHLRTARLSSAHVMNLFKEIFKKSGNVEQLKNWKQFFLGNSANCQTVYFDEVFLALWLSLTTGWKVLFIAYRNEFLSWFRRRRLRPASSQALDEFNASSFEAAEKRKIFLSLFTLVFVYFSSRDVCENSLTEKSLMYIFTFTTSPVWSQRQKNNNIISHVNCRRC